MNLNPHMINLNRAKIPLMFLRIPTTSFGNLSSEAITLPSVIENTNSWQAALTSLNDLLSFLQHN